LVWNISQHALTGWQGNNASREQEALFIHTFIPLAMNCITRPFERHLHLDSRSPGITVWYIELTIVKYMNNSTITPSDERTA
jgi:hypothetical protein